MRGPLKLLAAGWLSMSAHLLLVAAACGYAIGDGDGGGEHLAHQWITHQGWQLFQSQFGPSEIDGFLGDIAEYPLGGNNRFIEGAYDEDVAAENPWGEGGLNHPSLRHFWDHYGDFSRDFDDGVTLFDSAANRAVKYFTGGRDLVGSLDSGWGGGQGAAPGIGIPHLYLQGDRDTAYYWLGHVAHLLQDVSLPAHSHADAHLEGFGPFDDPDPVHDWVDGREFATSASGADGRPAAAFDDVDPRRYMRWRYLPALDGVGRVDDPTSVLADDLRSPLDLLNPISNPSLLKPEVAASLEPSTLSTVEPLYALTLELASIVDDFDSRDVDGQTDMGGRRDAPGGINRAGQYNAFTREELDAVADVIVPHAMRATAELIRYFYGQVDATPPNVELSTAASDSDQPMRIAFPEDAESILFSAHATAADPTSGVDLDGFRLLVEREVAGGFEAFSTSEPTTGEFATSLPGGLYRITASVTNGAGLSGQSTHAYVEVLPELTADFDGDGDVDGDDLLDFLLGFGTADAMLADGDADRDGDVDRDDLAHWRREVGAMTGTPGSPLSGRAHVPEPGALTIAVVLLAMAWLAERRRNGPHSSPWHDAEAFRPCGYP